MRITSAEFWQDRQGASKGKQPVNKVSSKAFRGQPALVMSSQKIDTKTHMHTIMHMCERVPIISQ